MANIEPGEDNKEEDNEENQENEETFENMSNQMLGFSQEQTKVLTMAEILDVSRFIHGLWCDEGYDVMKLQERNSVFFGDRNEVLKRFRFYSSFIVALDKRFCNLSKDDDTIDPLIAKEINDNLTQISANVLWGYDSMIQTYRQLYCNQPELLASLPPLRIDSFFLPMVEEEMKTHQKLIRFYLEECSRRGYRRYKSCLFAPKFTEDGHFTRTYTFALEIIEFIFDAIYPYYQHIWLFSALTERSGVIKQCQDYLENCRDDDLPVLTKDRTKFAFKNGKYDARCNQFYPYGIEPDWKSDTFCANYIDVDFEFETYQDAMAMSNDPMNIPTPSIQKILDSQEYDVEVCRWFYASMGRMIFPIGEEDNWQFFPFCKGTAGSGKSTLLRLTSKFYNDVDVGNLMSEGQKNFSIEHIYDKYVFFCYDVDDKMNFSLTRWNQMVSGESISVERKFKIPIQGLWVVNGAFAGNSYPPWVDQAGNVSRRMLIFMFSKVVRNSDPKLFDKCLLELGAFMYKCVSCYFQLRTKYGSNGIWDKGVLPKYFHQTKRQMQAETNPLQSFLQSDQCNIGALEHVGFTEFRAAYLAFCELLRLPKKRLTPDFCNPLFDPQDIAIIEVPANSNPDAFDGYSAKYIAGVSLRE
jgi:hypothetical protein